MKSFILGVSTLFAVAVAPAAAQAQAQVEYGDPAVTPSSAPEEWGQGSEQYPEQLQGQGPDGAYQPPAEAMPQQPQSFGFFGPHPVPYDQGGGFCTHTGAHEHQYPVFDRNLFRVVNGYAAFIGDPADFGYQSQSYVYRADHPIDAGYGGGFCYMSWPHHHWFAPASVDFAWDGSAYAYTGIWSPAYYAARPMYVNYFNSYYRNWYLGGGYYSRRPSPIYGGWGWHRPMYGSSWQRPGYGYGYNRGWSRPGYATPGYRAPAQFYRPGYAAPGYRAPAPMYRSPAPMYRAPGQVYRSPAPMYRSPAPMYRSPAPMYHAPAFRAPAPAYHVSTPAYRPAPSFGGGGRFGGGGGGHFGGGGGGHRR